jgi:signal transduction histidine kinase
VPASINQRRSRWRPADVGVKDVAIAVVAVGIDLALFTAEPRDNVAWTMFDASRTTQVAVGLLAMPVLCVRRRAPLTVCLVLSAYAAAQTFLIGSRPLASLLVALFTAAAHCSAPRALAALGAVLTAHGFTVAYESTVISARDRQVFFTAATASIFVMLDVGAWGFGRWAAATRTRVGLLEANRKELAARAVAGERLRIARELHDIVAHSVTVMVLHAAGARRLVGVEPELAGEAMRSVEDVGKQAMAELRRLLLVLRSVGAEAPEALNGDDDATPGGPYGVSTLDALARQVEAVGVKVRIDTSGTAGPLDPSIDRAAYRVVQEALTNVSRHSGPGSTTRVLLTWADDTLTIDVTDDGAGVPPRMTPTLSPGLGLIGLRERVNLVGGQLATGPRPEGGYRVSARLPAHHAVPDPTETALPPPGPVG